MFSPKNKWRFFVAIVSVWCAAALMFIVKTQLGWAQTETDLVENTGHVNNRVFSPPSSPSESSRYAYATFLCDDVMASSDTPFKLCVTRQKTNDGRFSSFLHRPMQRKCLSTLSSIKQRRSMILSCSSFPKFHSQRETSWSI